MYVWFNCGVVVSSSVMEICMEFVLFVEVFVVLMDEGYGKLI